LAGWRNPHPNRSSEKKTIHAEPRSRGGERLPERFAGKTVFPARFARQTFIAASQPKAKQMEPPRLRGSA